MGRPLKRIVIPSSFKLFGRHWTVQFRPQCRMGYYRGYPLRGLCQYDRRRILISKDQSDYEMERTFVHELLHAMMPEDGLPEGLEERIVKRLTAGVFPALRQGILKYE